MDRYDAETGEKIGYITGIIIKDLSSIVWIRPNL